MTVGEKQTRNTAKQDATSYAYDSAGRATTSARAAAAAATTTTRATAAERRQAGWTPRGRRHRRRASGSASASSGTSGPSGVDGAPESSHGPAARQASGLWGESEGEGEGEDEDGVNRYAHAAAPGAERRTVRKPSGGVLGYTRLAVVRTRVGTRKLMPPRPATVTARSCALCGDVDAAGEGDAHDEDAAVLLVSSRGQSAVDGPPPSAVRASSSSRRRNS